MNWLSLEVPMKKYRSGVEIILGRRPSRFRENRYDFGEKSDFRSKTQYNGHKTLSISKMKLFQTHLQAIARNRSSFDHFVKVGDFPMEFCKHNGNLKS